MPQQILAKSAAVATGHPLGAAAGLEILREGGNAIDAAVGSMLALCVVIPGSVGLGGYGGSAVIRVARTGQVIAVDFDSRAPLGYREGFISGDEESTNYGARSVSVPAVVAGLDMILRDFGAKSWREVSQPAIRLAEEGFTFDSEHQRYLNRCAPKFDPASLKTLFATTSRSEGLPQTGDHWQRPGLARLLRRLADDGPSSFYDGEIAQHIVRFLRDRGGILSVDDFHAYQPQIVDPVEIVYRGLRLYTPPPPSGGITSLGIVQTVERFLQPGNSERGAANIEAWSASYFHVLAEATKLCWQERHKLLGDPDFVNIRIDQLVSEKSAERRAAAIDDRAPCFLPRAPRSSSGHTANVIAHDAEGNLISLTATQGWMYGSHLVVDGMELVLNHGISRFDFEPDHPNAPAAGKRMQHNMSPLIALQAGRPAFAYGLPGGPKIVNVTAQLVLDTIAFGATPAASISAPRLHTVGNEPVLVSQHMPPDVVAEFERLGHAVQREDDMGGPVNVLGVGPQSGQINIASGETIGAVAGF
ncbi:MAG TPA: gamma-glutamyltransferase [Lacipirellulaceae bacterium]|nr:gamma-glutamyltransferase [Lacipirellulaceae bacterium]